MRDLMQIGMDVDNVQKNMIYEDSHIIMDMLHNFWYFALVSFLINHSQTSWYRSVLPSMAVEVDWESTIVVTIANSVWVNPCVRNNNQILCPGKFSNIK